MVDFYVRLVYTTRHQLGTAAKRGRKVLKMASVLVRDTTERKSSTHVVYQPQGGGPNVYIPNSLLGANPPEQINVDVDFTPAPARKTPVQKMTPEERKAAAEAAREARKNETPAQKAQRAQASLERAQKRAAKLAAEAAQATGHTT